MRTECQAAGCSSLLWRARPAVLTSLLPRGVGGGGGGAWVRCSSLVLIACTWGGIHPCPWGWAKALLPRAAEPTPVPSRYLRDRCLCTITTSQLRPRLPVSAAVPALLSKASAHSGQGLPSVGKRVSELSLPTHPPPLQPEAERGKENRVPAAQGRSAVSPCPGGI